MKYDRLLNASLYVLLIFLSPLGLFAQSPPPDGSIQVSAAMRAFEQAQDVVRYCNGRRSKSNLSKSALAAEFGVLSGTLGTLAVDKYNFDRSFTMYAQMMETIDVLEQTFLDMQLQMGVDLIRQLRTYFEKIAPASLRPKILKWGGIIGTSVALAYLASRLISERSLQRTKDALARSVLKTLRFITVRSNQSVSKQIELYLSNSDAFIDHFLKLPADEAEALLKQSEPLRHSTLSFAATLEPLLETYGHVLCR